MEKELKVMPHVVIQHSLFPS